MKYNDLLDKLHDLREKVDAISDELVDLIDEIEDLEDNEVYENEDDDILLNKLDELGEYLTSNLPTPNKFFISIGAGDNESMFDNAGVLFTKMRIQLDRSARSIDIPIAIKDLDGSIAEANYRIVSNELVDTDDWVDFRKFVQQVIHIADNFDNIQTEEDPSFAKQVIQRIDDVLVNCLRRHDLGCNISVCSHIENYKVIDFKLILSISTIFTVHRNGLFDTSFSYEYDVTIPTRNLDLTDATAKVTIGGPSKYIGDMIKRNEGTQIWTFLAEILQKVINRVVSRFSM